MTPFICFPLSSSLVEWCLNTQPHLGCRAYRRGCGLTSSQRVKGEQLTLEGPKGCERRNHKNPTGRELYQNWGVLSTAEGEALMDQRQFRELIMMIDHGLLSWTSCAEMSKGADGSGKVPDQWIRGLTDRRGATPLQRRAQ